MDVSDAAPADGDDYPDDDVAEEYGEEEDYVQQTVRAHIAAGDVFVDFVVGRVNDDVFVVKAAELSRSFTQPFVVFSLIRMFNEQFVQRMFGLCVDIGTVEIWIKWSISIKRRMKGTIMAR